MSTAILPGIIQQRWDAATSNPSLMQWHSLAVWLEDFARICGKQPETAHLVPELENLVRDAWRKVAALQPVEVAA